jgi:hypothetical protein
VPVPRWPDRSQGEWSESKGVRASATLGQASGSVGARRIPGGFGFPSLRAAQCAALNPRDSAGSSAGRHSRDDNIHGFPRSISDGSQARVQSWDRAPVCAVTACGASRF